MHTYIVTSYGFEKFIQGKCFPFSTNVQQQYLIQIYIFGDFREQKSYFLDIKILKALSYEFEFVI